MGARIFECGTCHIVLRGKKSFAQHCIANEHEAERCCRTCCKAFTTDFGFARHCIDKHHEPDRCCWTCRKVFKAKRSLLQHCSAKDHDAQPSCSTCKRRFACQTAQQQHCQTVHAMPQAEQETRASGPSVCSGSTTRSGPVTRPMTKSTRARATTGAASKCVIHCHVCRRSFGSSSALEQHQESKHSTRALEPLVYKGNSYTALDAKEQEVVYGRLKGSCHLASRLRDQGFAFANQIKKHKSKEAEYAATPEPILGVCKRKAIALDCEMAGGNGGQNLLIHVCAIDFLTGETLVQSLVYPRQMIRKWRTRCHGITRADMQEALAQNKALDGWQEARAELWKHMDATTIVVGHAAHNDLEVLRIKHTRIVDTCILTSEAVCGEEEKLRHKYGLKDLCSSLCGVKIRGDELTGSDVHDSMEDALATREVALWCLKHPDKLERWALYESEKHEPGFIAKLREQERRDCLEALGRCDSNRFMGWDDDSDDDWHDDWGGDEYLGWQDFVLGEILGSRNESLREFLGSQDDPLGLFCGMSDSEVGWEEVG